MKCPYCLSACDDKALVCPNCSRDLIFYIPLSQEINRLSQKFEDFVDQLQHVKLEVIRPVSARRELSSKIFDAGKVLVVYALQWVMLRPVIENLEYSVWWELKLYWAYYLMAIPYGVWLGFRRPRGGVVHSILVGIGLGLVDVAIRGTFYDWAWSEARGFFIRDLLWFYTGSILGRLLARWIGSEGTTHTQQLTVDELLQGTAKPTRRKPSLNERGEQLKAYASVLVPLLSIISTVVAIYNKM